jgi:hypothetical protein
MGGSIKKGFGGGGKFWRSVNKVVDPLNIMDPMGVLPTSMITGKKPFQFDRSFGKLQWKFGGGGSTPYSMPRSKMDTSGMFSAQNQMLASMKAQSASDLARRQASNESLRAGAPLLPPSSVPSASSQVSTTSATTASPTIAQSKISDTTSGADLPVEFMYKPASTQQNYVASNQFNLPDMSNIKFGGT